MRATVFEFRVLSGVHEGAVVSLSSDSGSTGWRVGRDEAADLLLSDLPIERAQLSWQVGGWRWQDVLGEIELSWGQVLRLAGLGLQCGPSDTPWPDTTLWQSAPDRLAGVGVERPSAALDGEASEGEPAESDKEASHDRQLDPVSKREHDLLLPRPPSHAAPSRDWRRRGLLLGGGVLVLSLLGIVYQVLSSEAQPEPSRVAQQAEPRPDPVAALHGVRQQLLAHGLSGQVRALSLPNGRIRILGVVASDEVLDQLVHKLSSWTPLLSLEVLTQAEFSRQVAALAPRWPRLTLRAGNEGRVWVEGRADPGLDPAQLVEVILQAIPEAAGVGLDGLLSPMSPQAPASLVASPSLPRVAAVVSGDRAYVLLADGRRLLPGAQVRKGLTVARIEDKEVIFETQSGQTFAMNRGRP